MRTATCFFLMALVIVSAGCRRQAPAPPVAAAPSAAPAAAPAVVDAVPEIAAYPGATQLLRKEEVNKDGFARVVEVKLRSTDPFADVKAFYASAIAAGGWQVAASEEKLDEAEWKLTKGTAVAKIEIDTRSNGEIEISIERKDR
ncbi:MAG TPA: hypothetical protein P5234_01005 [Thermoanaerobaculaceae bacterium]|nr:hypothetical protein [Thermoanaerobaculaceae bacterium]HRS14807.1 hypothetical protein [Thermoanaerobaculaceae bacterium]